MLKEHKIAIFFSLLVGLIFSLNNILLFLTPKPGFVFTPLSGGDENLYAVLIKKVYDGENVSKLPLMLLLPSLVLGMSARIVGSVERIFLIGDFIFPAINFLLIYYFIYLLTKKKALAILGGSATLFIYNISTNFPPITSHLFKNFVDKIFLRGEPIYNFNRLISIQFTFIFLILFLIVLQLFLRKPKTTLLFLSGILAGSLSYIYFYHWTAALAILFFLLVLSFLNHKKNISIKIIYIILISLSVSLPYFWYMYLNRNLAFASRLGLVNGRVIEPLATLRYLIFALIILFLLKKNKYEEKIILIAIALAGVLCMNVQLITGFNVAPGHWPYSTFEPLVVIISVVMLSNFQLLSKIISFMIIIVLVHGILGQIKVNQLLADFYYLPHQEIQLFNFFNKKTNKKDVILSLNKRLSRYLGVSTKNNFYLPFGFYSPCSCINNDQIWDRVLLAFSFYNLNNEEVKQELRKSQFVGQIFDQTYNFHKKSDISKLKFPDEISQKIQKADPIYSFGVRWIPDNILEEKINDYEKNYKVLDEKKLCRYKLDYLILSKESQSSLGLSDKYWEVFFENKKFLIFKLKNNICK